MKKIVLFIIKVYQRTISPDSGIESYKNPQGFCRFYPNCSQYSYQAIEKYGIFKGVFKSIIRIIKCNPFNNGGYDPLK